MAVPSAAVDGRPSVGSFQEAPDAPRNDEMVDTGFETQSKPRQIWVSPKGRLSFPGPVRLATRLWRRQPFGCRKVGISLGALTRVKVDEATILVGNGIILI
jgi:hypothetical protein